MIVGHYATALVADAGLRGKVPLWLLLLCANIPEFLWLTLALAGIEAPFPASLLDASLQNLRVDMVYSHNLVPALLQGAAVGVAVYLCLGQRAPALWCAGLTLFHVVSDFAIGFEHQVLGRASATVSLNSYALAPHLALGAELVFSLACVAWYRHRRANDGRPMTTARCRLLYLLFGGGVLMWVPGATSSLRTLLGSA